MQVRVRVEKSRKVGMQLKASFQTIDRFFFSQNTLADIRLKISFSTENVHETYLTAHTVTLYGVTRSFFFLQYPQTVIHNVTSPQLGDSAHLSATNIAMDCMQHGFW